MKRISVRNRYESTTPCVLHANGIADSRIWAIIRDQFFHVAGKFSPVADHAMSRKWVNQITVLTWNTYARKGPFEQSCQVLGVPVKTIKIDFTQRPNVRATYPIKIEGTLGVIDQITTPYVMIVDAFDAILIDSPAKILDTFLAMYDANKVVFGAERGHFPGGLGTDKDEEKKAEGRDRPYLNSGFVIGRVERIQEVYRAAKAHGDAWTHDTLLTDQAVLKCVYVNSDTIEIDHHCRMVQNLFGVHAGELDLMYVENGFRLETV